MTCWPSRVPRGSAMTRALLSVTPPGANGTMSRTGLAGYACGNTAELASSAAKQNAIRVMYRPRRRLPPDCSLQRCFLGKPFRLARPEHRGWLVPVRLGLRQGEHRREMPDRAAAGLGLDHDRVEVGLAQDHVGLVVADVALFVDVHARAAERDADVVRAAFTRAPRERE